MANDRFWAAIDVNCGQVNADSHDSVSGLKLIWKTTKKKFNILFLSILLAIEMERTFAIYLLQEVCVKTVSHV